MNPEEAFDSLSFKQVSVLTCSVVHNTASKFEEKKTFGPLKHGRSHRVGNSSAKGAVDKMQRFTA